MKAFFARSLFVWFCLWGS